MGVVPLESYRESGDKANALPAKQSKPYKPSAEVLGVMREEEAEDRRTDYAKTEELLVSLQSVGSIDVVLGELSKNPWFIREMAVEDFDLLKKHLASLAEVNFDEIKGISAAHAHFGSYRIYLKDGGYRDVKVENKQ
ncbi:MAG: hypothetical protein PHP74_02960 [Candidatus Gracilibacteria bacterium]|nr:hypothetical protein [Candidatus Gracilibacteria bacterium]